jgi:predicted dehydrogenase
VYRCDNDALDHQLVQLEFANRVRASLAVQAFSASITRTVRAVGTHGEVRGDLERGELVLEDFANGRSERVSVSAAGGTHAGGDAALVGDFLERLARRRAGRAVEDAPSALAAAIESHLMAFAAERSRREARRVNLAEPKADARG